MMKRITNKHQLPERTDEGRKLAEDAMAPYLGEMQRAVEQETRSNFGLPEAPSLKALPKEKATCVITLLTGQTITFNIVDMEAQGPSKVMLTLEGEPIIKEAPDGLAACEAKLDSVTTEAMALVKGLADALTPKPEDK